MVILRFVSNPPFRENPGRWSSRGDLCQILGLLLAGSDVQDTCSTGHDQDAKDGEHQGAVVTGFRQIKATGVDHSQRSLGILAAIVYQHGDLVAVHSSGSGQQVMLQMLLGHVLQIAGIVDDLSVAGIVLDQTQDIGLVDVTQLGGFSLGDNDLDIILQQDITVIGANFGDGVGIVFQTLNNDLVLSLAGLGDSHGSNGSEQSSLICIFKGKLPCCT